MKAIGFVLAIAALVCILTAWAQGQQQVIKKRVVILQQEQEEPQYWIDIVQKKMEPMFSRLDGFEFKTYRAAGPSLTQQLQTRRERFWFCAAHLGYSK